MRDFQRSRVYKWEDDYFGETAFRLSNKKVHQVHINACKLLDIKKSGIIFDEYKKPARYCRNHDLIYLPEWACVTFVVLHETVHSAVRKKFADGASPHGREFMTLYLASLSNELKIPLHTLKESALQARLKILE